MDINDDDEDQAARRHSLNKKHVKPLSSDAESSLESEGEAERAANSPEIPAEYWQVQRLIKYVKAGNPTATIIAMSSLRDFNLKENYVQMAIKEASGLEVLLNILEVNLLLMHIPEFHK